MEAAETMAGRGEKQTSLKVTVTECGTKSLQQDVVPFYPDAVSAAGPSPACALLAPGNAAPGVALVEAELVVPGRTGCLWLLGQKPELWNIESTLKLLRLQCLCKHFQERRDFVIAFVWASFQMPV